ncbi:MAG: glutamate mutase L [Chloroflexota bacterium]
MQSALVFAIDPDVTSVYHFDVVEGRYRFLARGEVPGICQGSGSLTDLAAAAAEEIEKVTGRSLFLRGHPAVPETPDGSGVDLILAVCRPAGQLRVAVVGGERDLLYDSAVRAVESAGHLACFTLSTDKRDVRTTDGLYDLVRKLWRSEPDVVLVAADAQGRGDEGLAVVAKALGAPSALAAAITPAILFAGSEMQEAAFRQAFGAGAETERVPPLRPAPEEENLQEARAILARMHAERWLGELPDAKRFMSWLSVRPVHSDLALGRITRFLSGVEGGGVLAVDFDRRSIGLFLAAPPTYAAVRYRVENLDLAKAERWLKHDVDGATLARVTAALSLRPAALPGSEAEVVCEGALFRAACREIFEDPRLPLPEAPSLGKPTQLLGTGRGTAIAASPADAAMLLLDSVQPTGAGYLRWDALSLLAPVGVLAELQPRLAADLALGDAAPRLGFFVAPTGILRQGTSAAEVDLEFADRVAVRLQTVAGELDSLPLPVGERASLVVRTNNPVEYGSNWGRKVNLEAEGTSLGIIVDTRGRPVDLPKDDGARRATLTKWRECLGAEVEPEVSA